MAIPLASTTITVRRPAVNEDPYDTDTAPSTVVTGIRAHFSSPGGRTTIAPGEQSVTDMILGCDPCDLQHIDLVIDDATGVTYTVVWVTERLGLGLDHLEAGVNVVNLAGSNTAGGAGGLAFGGVSV